MIFPWSEENMPPLEFLKKVKETQRQETKEFLSTLLNHDLEPNYRQKAPCFCPPFSYSQEVSRPVNSQKEYNAPPNNIFTSLRMTQTHKRPRRQQTQKKIEMKSDWSTDMDDRKDDQARKKYFRLGNRNRRQPGDNN